MKLHLLTAVRFSHIPSVLGVLGDKTSLLTTRKNGQGVFTTRKNGKVRDVGMKKNPRMGTQNVTYGNVLVENHFGIGTNLWLNIMLVLVPHFG